MLVWEKDSERVEIEALRKTDKFQAQVDRITGGKNYKRRNGEYFTPRIVLRGGEYPTYSEYVATQIQEALDNEISEPDDDDDTMTYTS